MRAAQQKDVEKYFPVLESLLQHRKLPCEHGPARIVSVDEFMLMSVSESLQSASFKHRDTRNYVELRQRFDAASRKNIWILEVPCTSDAFNLGFFDKF